MKILSTIVSSLLMITAFCSCSKDEEYEPQHASAILNTLYMQIVDQEGKELDYVKLLSEDKLFVVGKTTKQKAKLEVLNYKDSKVVGLSVELPDTKSMSFNSDRTEGQGKTDLELEINGKKTAMSVNFVFSSSGEQNVIGGSSIRIKDIEYNDKEVTPTEQLSIYSIKIKQTNDGIIVSPL